MCPPAIAASVVAESQPRRFYRTTVSDQKIAGVCGGVARYLNADPTLIRILWVIGTIVFLGVGLVAYAIFWIAAPPEDQLRGRPPVAVPAPKA